MAPMILNSIAAAGAAAIVALTSFTGFEAESPYGDRALTRLSQTEAASHAMRVFMRADRNGDHALDVDEFAALTIVTAELAHLNGFIAVDKGDVVETIALPVAAPTAISAADHIRIEAVARHTFYAFSGGDGRIEADEYARLQQASFKQADLNSNGFLVKHELDVFAQRQAQLSTGA